MHNILCSMHGYLFKVRRKLSEILPGFSLSKINRVLNLVVKKNWLLFFFGIYGFKEDITGQKKQQPIFLISISEETSVYLLYCVS